MALFFVNMNNNNRQLILEEKKNDKGNDMVARQMKSRFVWSFDMLRYFLVVLTLVSVNDVVWGQQYISKTIFLGETITINPKSDWNNPNISSFKGFSGTSYNTLNTDVNAFIITLKSYETSYWTCSTCHESTSFYNVFYLTAKKVGTYFFDAIVSYFADDGNWVPSPGGHSYQLHNDHIIYTITVNNPVTSVSLDQSNATIAVGEELQLNATVKPSDATNPNVVWESSDVTVATVSSFGLVKGLKDGTCNITATSEDGTKITAKCALTVKKIMVSSVTLDKTKATINVGDQLQLTGTVLPSNATDKSLSWYTTNTSVATVDGTGLVTAKKKGSCNINVWANDGSKKYATCEITVENVMVSSLTLNESALALAPGKKFQLTATVSPSNATNQEIQWSTSKSSVATVTSTGLVTAKGDGTCTITAKAKDGSGKTATCTVTVESIKVNAITLNYSSENIKVGSTLKLTAKVSPSNATNKTLLWSTSDSIVAIVDNVGNVTGLKSGSCVITAAATDGTGVSANCLINVAGYPVKGDANGDGIVTITDASMIINYVLGNTDDDFIVANCDLNGDGDINITDIMETVNIILGVNSSSEDTISCPDDKHPHIIDLGLPSGTKWACCNVGANTPEEYGGYYSWGEIEEKNYYNWGSYTHCDGAINTCHNLGSDIAGSLHDVAFVKWGAEWVMPSYDQFKELLDNCFGKWTNINGVNGYLFTSLNGGAIFLPAAGYRWDSDLYDGGDDGYYWSSLQHPSESNSAYYLIFGMGSADMDYSHCRCDGRSVRPIYVANTLITLVVSTNSVEININDGDTQTVEITSGSGSYTISSSNSYVATADLSGNIITITGVAPGTAVVTVTDNSTGSTQDISVTITVKQIYLTCPDDHHPHLIDLGLPSGTKWACCNVGADIPEACGGYYAWGETEAKDSYEWSTYTLCDGASDTCYDLGSDIAGTKYDVAHMKWGGLWVTPTRTQFKEICDYCISEWITLNGVRGIEFIGANGCRIFLPAAGGHWGVDNYVGSRGYYWSSTLHSSNFDRACDLFFDSVDAYWNYNASRFRGHSIRPVYVETEEVDLILSSTSETLTVGEKVSVEITSGSGSYTTSSTATNVATASLSDATITITGVAPGTAVVIVTDNSTGRTQDISVTVTSHQAYLTCPDDHHPHLIDLGLPSGTKWACCNVGATTPGEFGGYYAWGEIDEKEIYKDDTYAYELEWAPFYVDLGDDISGTEYDVAYVKWGGSWVMPNREQINEMRDNCTSEWATFNGVNGRKFTGSNGGVIFVPAAGYRLDGDVDFVGDYGYYWSSTPRPLDLGYGYAYDFKLSSSGAGWRPDYRYLGFTIRPVFK